MSFPGKNVAFLDEDDPRRPRIYLLDSLGHLPTSKKLSCRLRAWMRAEYEARCHDPISSVGSRGQELQGRELEFQSGNFPVRKPKTVKQPNDTDCGLFMLEYVEFLLQNDIMNQQQVANNNKQLNQMHHTEQDWSDWFIPNIATAKRQRISEVIKGLETAIKQGKGHGDVVEGYKRARNVDLEEFAR